MAGKRGKTRAGIAACARTFEFSRMEMYGLSVTSGREKWRRLFLVHCIDCGQEFETRGGLPDGKTPADFAYSLNWRCVECRDPASVANGKARFAKMRETLAAKKAAQLGVADLL